MSNPIDPALFIANTAAECHDYGYDRARTHAAVLESAQAMIELAVKQAASTPEEVASELTPGQRALAQLMSDLSEDMHYAKWHSGLEYQLWSYITKDGTYTIDSSYDPQVESIAWVSAHVGGWIYFDDETGETFIPFQQWQEMYAKKMKA